jgi:hypothetical protein
MNAAVQHVNHPPHATTHEAPATAMPLPANDLLPSTPGVDPFDFMKSDRIHVKDGSLFIDGYLVLHPHELAPENEEKLKQKLALTYSVNNPSFYESKDRLAIALNLGQLIPVSLATKHGKLQDEISSYNHQVDSGTDAELLRLNNDKQHPFAAIVRDTIGRPAKDPVGIETLKNGLSIYLLMREKLTSMGYRNGLASYVTKANTPDQVLTDLGDKIGVTPLQVREAALKGGIDGVGQLLGLDTAYVKDVKAFVDYDATQEFSLNAIEHWHQGRHLLGVAAPIAQKIAIGMQARIEKTIANARERVHHFYEVPDPIKHEETMVAQAMGVLAPIQRALMYKLGYEICYTPEMYADGIAFYPGVYGLHRKAANDRHDPAGTYHVYFSGHGDMKAAWRTLAHESAHLLNPEQFKPEEVAAIDALAKSDEARFRKFDAFMDAHFVEFDRIVKSYVVGTPAEQAAILATAREQWPEATYGVDISAIIPYLHNGQDFLFLVKHATDTLEVEGSRYAKSGYNSPHERFREVISRFAELKQVEYEAQPQLLHFVAPGLDQIWERHYIPHLERMYRSLEKSSAAHVAQPKLFVPPAPSNDAAEAPKVDQQPNPEPVAPAPAPIAGTLPNPEPVTPAPIVVAPEPIAPAPVPEPVTPPIAATPVPVAPTGTPDIAIDVTDAIHAGTVNNPNIAAAMDALAAMGISAQR